MPPCDTIYRRRLAPKKKPRSEAGLSTMTSGEGRPPRRHFNARMSVRFQPLTTLTAGRPNLRTSSGPSGSGGARLGPSQKDGLPHRCWDRHWRFKAIDSRVTSPLRENIPRPQRAQFAPIVNLAVSSRNVLARKSPAGLRAAGVLWCRPIGVSCPTRYRCPPTVSNR